MGAADAAADERPVHRVHVSEFFTGRFRAALHDLDRAYGLDPYGPAGRPGGLLDQARAKVEGR